MLVCLVFYFLFFFCHSIAALLGGKVQRAPLRNNTRWELFCRRSRVSNDAGVCLNFLYLSPKFDANELLFFFSENGRTGFLPLRDDAGLKKNIFCQSFSPFYLSLLLFRYERFIVYLRTLERKRVYDFILFSVIKALHPAPRSENKNISI